MQSADIFAWGDQLVGQSDALLRKCDKLQKKYLTICRAIDTIRCESSWYTNWTGWGSYGNPKQKVRKKKYYLYKIIINSNKIKYDNVKSSINHHHGEPMLYVWIKAVYPSMIKLKYVILNSIPYKHLVDNMIYII